MALYNEAYGSYDEETKSEMVNEEIVARFIETTLSEPKRLLDEIDGNTSLIGRIKDILKTFVSQQDKLTQSDKTLVNKAYNAFKSAIETKKTDNRNYMMSANAKSKLGVQYDLNDGIDNDENWYYNDVMQKEDKDNGRERRYLRLCKDLVGTLSEHSAEQNREMGSGTGRTKKFSAKTKNVGRLIINEVNELDYSNFQDSIKSTNSKMFGVKTKYYIGNPSIDGVDTKKIRLGFFDENNKTVYLCSDEDISDDFMTTINNHEVFHYIYRQNRALGQDLTKVVKKNVGEINYKELEEAYKDIGYKINIDEEILADIYSDATKLAYRDYKEVTQAFEKLINLAKPTGATQYSLSDSKGRTLTQEQAEFFKDSKVRDNEGNLLVVYHGSAENFTIFDKNKIGQNYSQSIGGFFFTNSKNTASVYAKNKNGRVMSRRIRMVQIKSI